VISTNNKTQGIDIMARLVDPSTGESHLIDDIDFSKPAETFTFALEGTIYAIELSSRNAVRLQSLLQEFIIESRVVGHYSNDDLSEALHHADPLIPGTNPEEDPS
jgi:hypothetical protein